MVVLQAWLSGVKVLIYQGAKPIFYVGSLSKIYYITIPRNSFIIHMNIFSIKIL